MTDQQSVDQVAYALGVVKSVKNLLANIETAAAKDRAAAERGGLTLGRITALEDRVRDYETVAGWLRTVLGSSSTSVEGDGE